MKNGINFTISKGLFYYYFGLVVGLYIGSSTKIETSNLIILFVFICLMFNKYTSFIISMGFLFYVPMMGIQGYWGWVMDILWVLMVIYIFINLSVYKGTVFVTEGDVLTFGKYYNTEEN